MLHVCVQRFDVTDTVEFFLELNTAYDFWILPSVTGFVFLFKS